MKIKYKTDTSKLISKPGYFGESALLSPGNNSLTAIAQTKVTCLVIPKHFFQWALDETIQRVLQSRLSLQDTTIEFSDLIPIKKLGSGLTSTVFLCGHAQTSSLFSLKAIPRNLIERLNIYENLKAERAILTWLDHPLIMKLIRTFKDEERVYFLQEFVNGEELFDVLQTLSRFTELEAQFYVSCLVHVFEYLHSKFIAYRDLKPENVIIDSQGYPKLIDFGAAKVVHGRTSSYVGTPHYMAPEVISGKEYTTDADWWSLGVMTYEFLHGGVPFGKDTDNPNLIYQDILINSEELLLDPKLNDGSCEFIKQLLNLDPKLRSVELKQHSWLAGFKVESLIERTIKPRFIPKSRNYQMKLEKAKRKGTSLQSYLRRFNCEGLTPSHLKELTWDEVF